MRPKASMAAVVSTEEVMQEATRADLGPNG